jgi:hypothetical protein
MFKNNSLLVTRNYFNAALNNATNKPTSHYHVLILGSWTITSFNLGSTKQFFSVIISLICIWEEPNSNFCCRTNVLIEVLYDFPDIPGDKFLKQTATAAHQLYRPTNKQTAHMSIVVLFVVTYICQHDSGNMYVTQIKRVPYTLCFPVLKYCSG